MKRFLCPLLCAGVMAMTYAQTFPTLTGTTLEDKSITLPQATAGKYSLLVLTYSAKASEQIAPWFDSLYDYFIMDPDYDMNLYVVPLISGAKTLIAGKIEKQLKKGVQKDYQKHFILYQGDIDDYKKTLRLDNKDVPYIFLLDPAGKIVYQTSGQYSDAHLDRIESKLPE